LINPVTILFHCSRISFIWNGLNVVEIGKLSQEINPAESSWNFSLLGAEVIQTSNKETTSTNPEIGDEEYKGLDLLKISKTNPRAFGNKVENLTHHTLLAVLMSGNDKEASDSAANLLNTCAGNVIHLCAPITQTIGIDSIRFREAHHIKAFKVITRFSGPHHYLLTKSCVIQRQWPPVNTLMVMDVVS
jgi:hypothetical protein